MQYWFGVKVGVVVMIVMQGNRQEFFLSADFVVNKLSLPKTL